MTVAGAAAEALDRLPVVGPVLASWPKTTLTALIALAIFVALYAYLYVYRSLTLPFANVPGPEPSSFFWGSLMEIIKAPPSAMHEQWYAEYGSTFKYRAIGGDWRLCSTDPGFLSWMLGHDELFPKPPHSQKFLWKLLGPGLVTVEGDHHARQRRVVSPAFSTKALKDQVPIFFDKAAELRDKLLLFVEGKGDERPALPPSPGDEEKGGRKIDVMKYLGQMAVDIIGQAGFGYDLASLSGHPKPLAEAFRVMMGAGLNPGPIQVLKTFIPFLSFIPTRADKILEESNVIAHREAAAIIAERTREVRAAGDVDEGAFGKDLLSMLLKSNMSSDLRPDQKMTDEDVFAQVTTFMLAGNETSATALTWILWRLAQHQDMQQRLRDECREVNEGDYSAVNSLPYLEAVVRESLRLDSPVPATLRVTKEDVTVPLSKPIRGKDGTQMDSVRLKKGTTVMVPIHVVNWAKDNWGADSKTFNPDRWLKEQSPWKYQNPGVFANLMTFNHGPHNCIGYRFSIAEIKVTLFTLIRALSFELLPSRPKFEMKTGIVMRPMVVGQEKEGPQMPLLVRALEA
ncbi:Cytochrome P450 [Trichosporon asahii var. asahii CBS 8904]|uniref:Cytochrome P450 n=1 Tax=Trichosporon asahii var. asahii (strain CBS 8904) TaxID=1220162 RepID=K1VJV5_TRIAC|nr:Cytochrome P450 [Trichosporon asahii var. asahii CBS 8904]